MKLCLLCGTRKPARGAVVCTACWYQDMGEAKPLHVSGRLPKTRKALHSWRMRKTTTEPRR